MGLLYAFQHSAYSVIGLKIGGSKAIFVGFESRTPNDLTTQPTKRGTDCEDLVRILLLDQTIHNNIVINKILKFDPMPLTVVHSETKKYSKNKEPTFRTRHNRYFE